MLHHRNDVTVRQIPDQDFVVVDSTDGAQQKLVVRKRDAFDAVVMLRHAIQQAFGRVVPDNRI